MTAALHLQSILSVSSVYIWRQIEISPHGISAHLNATICCAQSELFFRFLAPVLVVSVVSSSSTDSSVLARAVLETRERKNLPVSAGAVDAEPTSETARLDELHSCCGTGASRF